MSRWILLAALGLCYLVAKADDTTTPPTVAEDSPPVTHEPSQLESSHWGVGLGTGWINDYPGSAQGRTRFLAVPTYKGKHLTIDRQEGVKSELVSQSRFKFSISFSFLFPTASDKIPVRTGMPNLDWTLQLGPELQIYLYRSLSHTMFIRLPFRFVATTDFSHRFEYRQWNLAPSLRNIFYLGRRYGEIATRLELDYSSEAYSDYFYEVAPRYATPFRPAYNAKAGLMETTVGINYSYYNLFPWTFFVGANLYFLGDAKNTESPLLVKHRNSSILGGIIRYF